MHNTDDHGRACMRTVNIPKYYYFDCAECFLLFSDSPIITLYIKTMNIFGWLLLTSYDMML